MGCGGSHTVSVEASKKESKPEAANMAAGIAVDEAKRRFDEIVRRAESNISVGELRSPSGIVRIQSTEDRGISIPQLERVLQYVSTYCHVQRWTSSNPHAPMDEELEADRINLYDLVHWVVKPATKSDQCSYVELVAEGPQLPKWFVSHWWGEPVALFIQCLRQHRMDRELPLKTPYWVCAYANNQWVLGGDVSADPAQSSFRRAMDKVEGTVTVLDAKATTYTRVWCVYEIYVSLTAGVRADGQPYLYDVYTTVEGASTPAVGITDGTVGADGEAQFAVGAKGDREKEFPMDSGFRVLDFDLKCAQASVDSDRRHILNAIAGASADHLEGEPPASHDNYERVNRLLQGRFALGIFRTAVESESADMARLSDAVRKSGVEEVKLSFFECQGVFAEPVARALPDGLLDLNLVFQSAALGDSGLCVLAPALGRLHRLQRLTLNLAHTGIGGGGAGALGEALGGLAALKELDLMLAANVKVKHEGLRGLAAGLGQLHATRRLKLNVYECRGGAEGAGALAAALGGLRELEEIELDLRGNKIGDEGLSHLAALGQLQRLRHLHMRLLNCKGSAEGVGVRALAVALGRLPELSDLMLDLRGNPTGEEGKRAMEELKAELERRGANAAISL